MTAAAVGQGGRSCSPASRPPAAGRCGRSCCSADWSPAGGLPVPPDSFDQPTGEGGTKKMRPSRCLLGVIANRKGRWVRFRRKMSPLLAALPKCATAAPASRLARCTRSRSAGSAAAGQSAGDRGQVVEVGTGVLHRRVAASGIHTHKADDDEREQAANYNRCDSLVCHDLFPPRREQWHGYFRRPIPARDIPLAEAGTAIPCSWHVRRVRGRCHCDPHRLRAAR